MSSSDSEKTRSDEVYISENSESSVSSSSRVSERLVDEDVEVIVVDKPVEKPSKKKSSKGKQPSVYSVKILKKWSSQYQEWVKAGEDEAPCSSSPSDMNPQFKNAPYACKFGGKKTSRSNILNKIETHKLRLREIARMPSLYYFDASVPFRLPIRGEELDSWSEDTIALSFEQFRYISPFPLPELIQELCSFYTIAPSQLSPHAWRLAAVAELLSYELNIKLDMFDLFGSYKLSEIRHGVYSFTNKQAGQPSWTYGGLPNDCQWDVRFVMIPYQAVIRPGIFTPPGWRRLSKSDYSNYFRLLLKVSDLTTLLLLLQAVTSSVYLPRPTQTLIPRWKRFYQFQLRKEFFCYNGK